MQFREWILLNEIQHLHLPKVMHINGIMTDGIDFRFEDWTKGYNPEKRRNVLLPKLAGNQFFAGPFSAKTDAGWLNVGEPKPTGSSRGNLGLAVMAKPEIRLSAEAIHRPLPNHWIDFAIFYLGNDVVKSPEWPRGRFEQKPVAIMEPPEFQHSQLP